MVKAYLGITVDAANRHDTKMTKTALQSKVVDRPEPTTRAKQHMCMDKGYDYPEVYELLEDYGYPIHISLRGEYRVNSQVSKAKREGVQLKVVQSKNTCVCFYDSYKPSCFSGW